MSQLCTSGYRNEPQSVKDAAVSNPCFVFIRTPARLRFCRQFKLNFKHAEYFVHGCNNQPKQLWCFKCPCLFVCLFVCARSAVVITAERMLRVIFKRSQKQRSNKGPMNRNRRDERDTERETDRLTNVDRPTDRDRETD